MKIYLAGSCSSEQRTLMVKIAKSLRAEGYDVYCPFELKIENAWDMSQEKWARNVFCEDMKALASCDLFLMISPGRYGSAGTNWEQGYMYAKGKKVAVVQYTNQPTSLMTYCGCDIFINSNEKDICHDIIECIKHPWADEYAVCTTILT